MGIGRGRTRREEEEKESPEGEEGQEGLEWFDEFDALAAAARTQTLSTEYAWIFSIRGPHTGVSVSEGSLQYSSALYAIFTPRRDCICPGYVAFTRPSAFFFRSSLSLVRMGL